MPLRPLLLAIALVLLAPTHVRAQVDENQELYHAEVCNAGELTVDVAVAYKLWGLSDPYWIVDYWWHVPAGECKLVFKQFYEWNALGLEHFPLHLAFAFTDATGLWGAARVAPPEGIAASTVQLCVGKENFKYRIEDSKTPQAECPDPRTHQNIAIPASIDWEPTSGRRYQDYIGYGDPKRFTVALSSADRAIPLGAHGPAPEITRNGKDADDFRDLLMLATRAPSGKEEARAPNGIPEPKPEYRSVGICAADSVVYKGSLTGLHTPRAIAITNAIRAYLSANANGPLRFEIEEPHGTPEILGLIGKEGDCVRAGQHEYQVQSPAGWAVPSALASEEFLSLLKQVMLAPGAPMPRRSSGPRHRIGVCIPKADADVPSWGGPQSARASVLKNALRQFVSSHQFADGDLLPVVRVTATGSGFGLQEIPRCDSDQLFYVDTHAEKPQDD